MALLVVVIIGRCRSRVYSRGEWVDLAATGVADLMGEWVSGGESSSSHYWRVQRDVDIMLHQRCGKLPMLPSSGLEAWTRNVFDMPPSLRTNIKLLTSQP